MLSPGFNAQHSIKPTTVERKLGFQEEGTGGLTKSSATEVTKTILSWKLVTGPATQNQIHPIHRLCYPFKS